MKSVQDIIEATGHDWRLTGEHVFHVRIENDPWMALAIEGIGRGPDGGQLISVAHYGEQNGDAMRDPDMVFRVTFETDGRWKWLPLSWRNDYAGLEREAARYRGDGTLVGNKRLIRELEDFARMWDKNIRDQKFVEVARDRRLEDAVSLPGTAPAVKTGAVVAELLRRGGSDVT